ncbi:MAG: histone deacetylase family protein [Acidimicrobiia bacterium]
MTDSTRLTMPCVWSPEHRLHQPGGEIWMGVRYQGTELPARGDAILAALTAAGAPVQRAGPLDRGLLEVVHDPDLVAYLETAWDDWVAAGYLDEPGQDRVVPYVFPIPGVSTGRIPTAMSARAGTFAFDTMTLIGPGSAAAILDATAVADTAARLVVEGAPAVYALSRPPGHHAGRRFFGGSCYLNNAAVAAARLRSDRRRVAVIDIDAHHGNGTQEIFYRDPDVWYGSVHVDPGYGWFPHFIGFADERGEAEGAGANRNLPLPPGSGDDPWLEAVGSLVDEATAWGAEAVVVSLGVDAAAADPESPLEVTRDGYAAAGGRIGSTGLPTVLVQEGGYDLATLGDLVVQTLIGVERGRETG